MIMRKAVGRLLRRSRPRPAVPRIWHVTDRGLVFVHVPKVATRSMRSVLARLEADEEDDGRPEHELIGRAVERYERMAEPIELRRLARDSFVFAFVRHPLDRLLSAYSDKVAGVDAEEDNVFRRHGIDLDASFEEFVEAVATIPDEEADRHLCSQHHFVCDREGVVVDFLGRFERLEQDWGQLASRFDLPQLPRRNVSRRGDFRDAYTPSLARLAAERYREDLERFGYDL